MAATEKKPRRGNGEGSLIKLKGCRFWYAQYYDQNGRKIRASTRTEIQKEALGVLRRLMGDRDRGLAPITAARKIAYKELRAGLLASYVEKGNTSLHVRATGEESVTALKQLDDFFDFSEDNPGPAVARINTDTGRAFVQKRQAEGAGAAVINRSLACLRRMLRIAQEDGKIQHAPIIRLLKEPNARKGFLPLEKFSELQGMLPATLRPLVTFLYYWGARWRGIADRMAAS